MLPKKSELPKLWGAAAPLDPTPTPAPYAYATKTSLGKPVVMEEGTDTTDGSILLMPGHKIPTERTLTQFYKVKNVFSLHSS